MEPNTPIPNNAPLIEPEPVSQPASRSSKPLVIISGIVILALVIIGGMLFMHRKTPVSDVSGSSSSTPDTTSTTEFPSQNANTDVVWNGKHVALPDLKLVLGYRDDLNAPVTEAPQPTQYYDLGMHGNNKIVLAIAAATDPGGPSLFFFEQTPKGYEFMSLMSTNNIYGAMSKQGYELSPNIVGTDDTTYYKGLVGPTDLTYNGLKLTNKYPYLGDFFDLAALNENGSKATKLATLPDGDLYKIENTRNQYIINNFELKLPSGFFSSYFVSYDFFSDNSVPKITWSDSTQNKDPFNQDAHLTGCGTPGAYVTVSHDISKEIQPAGITSTGETVYEFKDMNNPTVAFFYSQGGRMYNASTSQFEDLSLSQWYAHHAIVVYKNSLGDYLIFTNDNYGSGAECGKPVIYLYPTETTNVSVKVGADITKSEPLYVNGWQVKADPDGMLTTASGKTYGSLFWEGTGNGAYPEITEGIVVSQSEVKTTIVSNLKELGLSQKETQDFLDFWLPKMPDAPYVRLTWLSTADMNKLAPLVVWPKPDTVIRVFLDFQGLPQPIALPVEHLTSIPRVGFTLVEWGGLLQNAQ